MLKIHTPKKIVKQSTINSEKPKKVLHRKTISLVQEKQNLNNMQWDSYIEFYHQLKQINLINCSFNTINSHFREKSDLLSIHDVPYIVSEQFEDYDQQQPITLSQKNCQNLQTKSSFNNKKQINQNSMRFDNASKKNNIQKQYVKQNMEDDSDKDNCSQQNQESSQGSQNFTQEDQQERLSFKDHKSIGHSKNSISTNKNSQGVSAMIPNDLEEQCKQKLIKTAHFSEKADENQENINSQNRINNSKLMILKKIQQEKAKKSKQQQQKIIEDKQFLGRFIWK